MKKSIIFGCLLLTIATNIQSQEILNAIQKDDLQKVRELVEKNPQLVNKRGPNNYTPILFAADNDKIEIVEYLLSKGANIDDVFTDYYGYTPLIYAIKNDNLGMVKILIKQGANIQYRTNLGENYLHFAAAHNRMKIASYLIDCGIGIDSSKKGGLTPLHISALFGSLDVAMLLAKRGANLDVKSKDGGTALHYAMAARHDEVAALLRREGAEDKARKFPLYRGKYLGQKEPGTVPKLFVPELFLEIYRTYSAPAFSPDGNEVFWMGYIMPGLQENRIWRMMNINGRWTPPEVAPFSKFRSSSPAFSRDGKKLFFAAWGPVDGKIPRDSDLWVVEKRGNGWGEPRHLGFPPNKKGVYENYPVPARDGTIYFNAFGGGTRNTGTGMYRSKYVNGTYTEKLSLDGLFDADILDDCLAMDYMIFHTPDRKRSYGSQLFVCFHQSDGIWTRPIYLGDLFHQGLASNFGKISPDDKYFFFLQDIALYWVNAKIIEDLKPMEITVSDQDILKAIQKGDAEDVKAILSTNPDLVKIKDKWGRTPLHYAVDVNNVEIIECLIESGADVEATDIYSWTPLFRAIDKGKKEAVEALIAKGADVNHGIEDGFKPVHLASSVGNVELLELLLRRGADRDTKDRYGLIPLHIAAAYGFRNVVGLLISYKADVNAKSSDGRNPFHFAQLGGNQEIADLIKSKGANAAPEKYPEFKGKYLGFKVPGLKPEILFPGIIMHLNPPHNGITVSPDSKEIYWTETSIDYDLYSRIWFMKEFDGRWKPPQVASFSSRYLDGYPCFSVDGKRMIFSSNRPLDENMEPGDRNIWYVEKTEGGWSQPKSLGLSVNTDQDEDTPTIDKDGTLYFSRSKVAEGRFDINIYRSKFLNGQYEKSEKLEETVNSPTFDVYPFIAPDGSYLIYNTSRYGVGFQLCISFLKKDGSWTEAKPMKEVLGPFLSWCQGISTDGQYLFFAGHKNGVWDIYWVDAKIIEELKPEHLK